MRIKIKPEDFFVKEIIRINDMNDKGKYFIYKLTKKNFGTPEAINELERKNNCKFSYCGNKDKFAITKQYISSLKKIVDSEIYYGRKEKNEEKKGFIKINFVGKNNEPMSLGYHKKNYFEIKIHEFKKRKKPFEKESYCFPNYFGEQRFSTKNVLIGNNLLERNFKEASEFIDDKKIKEYLKIRPNDYLGAIKNISKKILRLYLASVQSFNFNKELSNLIGSTENKMIKNKQIKELNVSNQRIKFTYFEKNNCSDLKNNKIIMKGWDLGDKRFLFREYPDISLEGEKRDSFVNAEKIIFDGEKISFYLPKGSYATIFLRSIFLENIEY